LLFWEWRRWVIFCLTYTLKCICTPSLTPLGETEHVCIFQRKMALENKSCITKQGFW
jgi:hypothetical protein